MDKLQALLANRDRPLAIKADQFYGQLQHLLKTPGYTTDKSVMKDRPEVPDFVPKTMKETPMPEDKIEKRIAEGEAELQEELEILAKTMSDEMEATQETFMLSAPETLTVKRANGAYSKQAHIGSEDFAPARAYVGKRGMLIFVFKPVMVAEYLEMEMTEAQAREKLMGFRDFMKERLGDVNALVAEARASAAAKAELKSMETRSEAYKDIGFGTW